MRSFTAIEMNMDTVEATGRIEYYSAADLAEAVGKVLYTHKLHNGFAMAGRSGRTVLCGRLSYVVQRETKRA